MTGHLRITSCSIDITVAGVNESGGKERSKVGRDMPGIVEAVTNNGELLGSPMNIYTADHKEGLIRLD